jgi:hypothetical protein
MNRIALLLMLVFTLLLSSCQKINIEYIGQSFSKTAYTKIFFGRKEVKQAYDVMGKAIIRASTSFSTEKIQKKLRKTAEDKGADAVIVVSYKEVPAGMYAYNNYPMYGMYGGMYGFGGMCGMYPDNMNPYWGNMGWGMGEQSVVRYYDYLIRVLFIKFKDDINSSEAADLANKHYSDAKFDMTLNNKTIPMMDDQPQNEAPYRQYAK